MGDEKHRGILAACRPQREGLRAHFCFSPLLAQTGKEEWTEDALGACSLLLFTCQSRTSLSWSCLEAAEWQPSQHQESRPIADDQALPHPPWSWECECCWLAQPTRMYVGAVSLWTWLQKSTRQMPTEVESGIPKSFPQPRVSLTDWLKSFLDEAPLNVPLLARLNLPFSPSCALFCFGWRP